MVRWMISGNAPITKEVEAETEAAARDRFYQETDFGECEGPDQDALEVQCMTVNGPEGA